MKLLITELDNVVSNDAGLYEDALSFLRSAHEKFFIIILTNHPLKNTQERVKNLEISDYIDLVVSAAEYEMAKPDPRMINVLLALLNTEGKKFDKGDIVLVGDRPSMDVKLGNKAGVQTIRLRRGRYSTEEPDYPEEVAKMEVKNLSELAGALGVEMRREIKVEEPLKRHDAAAQLLLLENEEKPLLPAPSIDALHSDLSGEFDIGGEQISSIKNVKRATKSKPGKKRTASRKPKPKTKAKSKSRAKAKVDSEDGEKTENTEKSLEKTWRRSIFGFRLD